MLDQNKSLLFFNKAVLSFIILAKLKLSHHIRYLRTMVSISLDLLPIVAVVVVVAIVVVVAVVELILGSVSVEVQVALI